MSAQPELPEPVRRLIEAVNRDDYEGFLGAFADAGYVDDNGRRFTGRDEINGWSEREFTGAHTRLEITGSRGVPGGVSVDAEVSSSGFNGYSRFDFGVEGDRVTSMTIAA